MQNQTSPLILSFGACDPVGAMGVQADLATFSALSCSGLPVTTALLIGDSARIEDVQEVDPDWVCDQARVLLEDMTMAAFKVGALTNVEQVAAIAEILSDYPDAPLILDPFSSRLPAQGDEAQDELLTVLRQLLVPQASLLMLSQVELGRLAETWREGEEGTLAADIDYLLALGCEYVLVTGTAATEGQADGHYANTLYGADGRVSHDNWQHLAGPFIGAGSTLSAAIAAHMACGADAAQAVHEAQRYTHAALTHAQRYGMGKLVPNRFFGLSAAPCAPGSNLTLD
ncbi:bifunctional hydroxymethylpyrimidine kinase/phosphomethylpyrimidine kinase [Rugamonas apoptosis]|uniref:Hydroxymethylpyrimidine/phosphomethylpyrimidine kinase n=1 Tax=Rugamonas apoptosis TaxID=2758570 RepID=A0A7W2FAI3_9BURK|nr:bifunctional hydroxymethylpyrimidine kinase/phosphomethylpyrimidine kinase [Rugamonas apoptosis]MBA5688115.1 hydroxymethylpyrimidine/phosphomethylpyrimidine kinase [Rugamonas apoptosis]